MKKYDTLIFAAVAGVAGFLLRSRMYGLYLDEKGLLIPNGLSTALWGLTAAVIVLAAAFVRFGNRTLPMVPWPLHGAGSILFGLAMVTAAVFLPQNSLSQLRSVVLFLGAAAGTAMFLGGLMQLWGKPVPYVSRLLSVMFCMVYMICCYRGWSARPQIMDHAFDMLACVSLTLTAYRLCAESAGMAAPKKKTFFSLCTIFLCMTACAVGQCVPLYLGGVCFALTVKER